MTTAFLLVGGCLLLEMFFAAAEISIVSYDRILLRGDEARRRRSTRLLEDFLSNKHQLLATTLVGTQLAVVLATVIMTYALHAHPVFSKHVELYLLAGLAPITIMFGEIVPKTLARQHANWIAHRVVYPLWFASRVFSPFVWILTRVSGWVTTVLGVDERKPVTREELELLLTDNGGTQSGEITDGERKMISRIFQFTEVTVESLMIPLSDVVALSADTSLADAAHAIQEQQYSRFPIYEERVDHIVGIVHAFDILKSGQQQMSMRDVARKAVFATPKQTATTLLVEMQQDRRAMAVVVDEYGGAVGIVTMEDILEQVVGEIDDEYDTSPTSIRKEADGLWRVDAKTSVKEVNRVLRIDLPESDEYETIAGLVLHEVRHIPREGQVIRLGSVSMMVLSASERAILQVQIRTGRRRAN